MSPEEAVECSLAAIREREPLVHAWQFLDAERARAEARSRSALLASGGPRSPLHGVPVGIKDIIDTAGMPTENGTALHAGRVPVVDAAVVRALVAAGAIVMGKTVTTELATYAPGKTRNPHDASRTPGGSSSGSAAAVAAGMVPIAVGTQTNGSVIRPASYCGVVGYKPTHGWIPRSGILKLSRTLDSVGVFARTVADAARAAEVLVGHDADDPDTEPRGRPPLLEAALHGMPRPPRLAWVPTHLWPKMDEDARSAFEAFLRRMDGVAEAAELPAWMPSVWDWHKTIMEAEMAFNLQREWDDGRERLSTSLQGQLSRGRAMSALDYQAATAQVAQVNAALEAVFSRFDAIVTPATFGVAPLAQATGDPGFCTPWSFCGTPAITLPLLSGTGGLPLGVQLVGRRGDDARLMRAAAWLEGAWPASVLAKSAA